MNKVRRIVFGGFALVLLFAACLKLADPFLLQQLRGSGLVGLAIVADLSIAGLLLFGPQVRRTAAVVATLFLAYSLYLIFKLSTDSTTCNCFGAGTPLWLPLTVDLFGMCCFAAVGFFGSAVDSSTSPDGRAFSVRDWLINTALLIATVIGLSAFYQWNNRASDALTIATSELQLDSERTFQELKLEFHNRGAERVRIVGIPGSCQSLLMTSIPIEIEAGQSQLLSLAIGSDKFKGRSERFLRGQVKVFLEKGVGVDAEMSSAMLDWGVSY